MKKSQEFELRKRVGNLNALYGVTDYVLNDGPAKGTRVFSVNNGKNLRMNVAADRGLDIPFLSYKGKNMGFASKVGMRSPAFYNEDGVRGFLKQFDAGMLTTCGITYAGAPGEDEGRQLGLHGPYDNTPAEKVSAHVEYEGDDAVIRVCGSVREACVFGENMKLDRVLTVETEDDSFIIRDTVTNLGFEKTPVMLVYHINFGYPMLDEGAKVYTNAETVQPRDEFAKSGPGTWRVMDEPGVGRDEQCYFHTGMKGEDSFAMIHNEKLGLAGIVSFDPKDFPLLCQWKCMRAGDYALGLEPTMAGVLNRSVARKDGTLSFLEGGQSREFRVKVRFTDDSELIDAYKKRAN